MSEFTPGPWRVDDETRQIESLDPGYGVIGLVYDADGDRANAHLIAAAPELFAACKAALQLPNEFLLLQQEAQILRQIKTAIAKATGRPPGGPP